jgi:DNA-binding FadR family transcriptional regulator
MARGKTNPAAGEKVNPAPARQRSLIRIPKTSEVVAANIRKMIVRGEVKEGSFLQPEALLMQHFGTSRPTIREAFRILENEQLISVTQGSRSGAQVCAPNVDSVARYAGFALQAQGTLLSDIYLARLGIEPLAVQLLAQRRTEAQMKALNAELDAAFEILETGNLELRVPVFDLHHSIVKAAGSNTLTLMSAMLKGIAEQHMSKFRRAEIATETLRRSLRRGLRSFRKLFDLLEAGDAESAAAHWRLHIKNVNDTWLSGYDRTTLVELLD